MKEIIFSNTNKSDVGEALATLSAYLSSIYKTIKPHYAMIGMNYVPKEYLDSFNVCLEEFANSVTPQISLTFKGKLLKLFLPIVYGSEYPTFNDMMSDEEADAVTDMLDKLKSCAERIKDIYQVISLSDYLRQKYEETDGSIYLHIHSSKNPQYKCLTGGNKEHVKVINKYTSEIIEKNSKDIEIPASLLDCMVDGDVIDFSFADKELMNLISEIGPAIKYVENKNIQQFQIKQDSTDYKALPIYG